MEAVGGRELKVLTNNKTGVIKGYIIKVGNSKRPLTIRLMNAGAGQRKVAYFRIAREGKPCYTLAGKMSDNPLFTHLNLNPNTTVKDIKKIMNAITKNKNL